jgi:CheY-like chemotaxis protein
MKELSDCTVLVVDDNEANVDILVGALSDTYEVIVAMDGFSALETIRENPPDLILLDIMMPDIDGFEVCRRLKDNPDTASIPIIFLSALSEDEEKQKGLDLGAVDFITKPFYPAEIQTKVKQHLLAYIEGKL